MSTRDASNPDTVRQCARRRCRHLYRKADAVWVPEDHNTSRATCPKCGHDIFTLPKPSTGEPASEGGAPA